MVDNLWSLIQTLRHTNPLILNMTNQVVMNTTANALLAVGASPIMAHEESEIQALTTQADSLVINIGTLDKLLVESMRLALQQAHSSHKPWVLDPVGVGASSYRTETVQSLLQFSPSVIRGNATEIRSLSADKAVLSKGVDSLHRSDEALNTAKMVSLKYAAVVAISGATDYIIDGERIVRIENGDPMMRLVTGLGCTATALIGAFIARSSTVFESTIAAVALLSVVGELVAKRAEGPASLQLLIHDKLYNITEQEFKDHLKIVVG
ncbi:hydroxyethylthiazole kinase [Sphingobacteriaceae bacterium WQ 2009]|uniref:Hydroxyethylthiazole kinase n=1 Tax=Rhinopithecimicrobium faecis TaxID=2820698 RepID=A0A8T4HB42_9SPHI|nr:hydroxyethylthiazole kinase [Sphingobacteriaceae bacterium WQ 2009]